jgi:hypothetical protein
VNDTLAESHPTTISTLLPSKNTAQKEKAPSNVTVTVVPAGPLVGETLTSDAPAACGLNQGTTSPTTRRTSPRRASGTDELCGLTPAGS